MTITLEFINVLDNRIQMSAIDQDRHNHNRLARDLAVQAAKYCSITYQDTPDPRGSQRHYLGRLVVIPREKLREIDTMIQELGRTAQPWEKKLLQQIWNAIKYK